MRDAWLRVWSACQILSVTIMTTSNINEILSILSGHTCGGRSHMRVVAYDFNWQWDDPCADHDFCNGRELLSVRLVIHGRNCFQISNQRAEVLIAHVLECGYGRHEDGFSIGIHTVTDSADIISVCGEFAPDPAFA